MKKYILMLAAVLATFASCQKEEMAYFDPAKVVAPSLNSVSDILIDTENLETGKAAFEWTAADFGVDTQIYYSVEAYKEGSDTTVLASNLSGTKADISFSAINSKLLFDLELAAGMPEQINFILGAKLNKGEKYYSAPIAAKVTVVEVEKTYPGVYVLGEFNGWSHDKAQFLFDFAEEGKFFQGVVGLGSKASAGFKITGAASWDDATGNWGLPDPAPAAEAASFTLVNGSASNITIYSKSYYHFSLEKESLTLKMSKGFNSVSAVINGTEIPMSFNAANQRFFADVEVAAGSTVAFRFDDGTVLGGAINGLKIGGSAITYSEAGKYRLTLNMNNWNAISAVFDKGAYGSEEGGEEGGNEGGASAWGIVGDFNGWSEDIAMIEENGYFVAKGVEIAADQKFKFRKDGKWASDGGDERTSAANPVSADTEYAAVSGYDGIEVAAAGTYDIYLKTSLDRFYVMTEGKTPADAEKMPEPESVTVTIYSDNAGFGNLYGWWSNEGSAHFTDAWPGTQAAGTEDIDGVTYKKFVLTLDKTLFETTKVHFILNDGTNQTADSDAITLAETMYITVADNKVVVKGGQTSGPETETVPVTFYCENVGDNAKYTHIYGWWNIEASDNWFTSPWPGDASAGKETVDGVEYIKWVVDVDKAKFDAQTTVQIILNDGKSEGAQQTGDSDRLTLTETVFLTIKDGKPVLKDTEEGGNEDVPTESWGIIGLGGDWETDKVMTLEGDYWTAKGVAVAVTDQFKFRKDGKWASDGGDERTSNGQASIDKENAATTGYGNITVGTAGTYDIYLSKTLDKFFIMTQGKTPADAAVAEKVTVTVYSDVEKTYLYGFWTIDNSPYFTEPWPGSANEGTETVEGVQYFKWTLSIDKERFDAGTKVKFVLSNGDDATKTNDSAEITLAEKLYLTIDGSNNPVVKTGVDDGNGDQSGDEDTETYTITVYGNSADNFNYLYSWTVETGNNIFGSWPGKQATAINETINGITYTKKWEVTVSKEVYEENGAQFIMNDGKAEGVTQTSNSGISTFDDKILLTQKKEGDNRYINWDNRPAENGTTEISVYCETDFTHLYGWWSDGAQITDTWPGTSSTTKETLNGKSYKKWTFEVSSSRMTYDRAKFLLNNGSNGGSGNQTEDSIFYIVESQTIITAPAVKTE